MAHAVSTFSFRSDRISPAAVALAVLLHGTVALILWWLAQAPPKPPQEEVIEITLEQPKAPDPPKPAEPPKPPPPQPKVQPAPKPEPMVEGLKPPAPIVSDKRTQVPPAGDPSKDTTPAPAPPPEADTPQQAEPPPEPPAATEQAAASPKPEDAGERPKPPLPAPAPPQKQALMAPPPKPQPPASPPPQPLRPQYKPSPQTTMSSRLPPAGKPSDNSSHSPFVNPADAYNRARAADNYLWQVVRKLQGYRYYAHVNASQGITVVRIVIARDGRLLRAEVARSSGYDEFDRGVLAGVRAGSPYAPLPSNISGDSATFDLPLVSINRQ